MTGSNGNGLPDEIDPNSPWQRLLFHFRTHGLEDCYFNVACGVHLGIAAAVNHPIWAKAMSEALDANMRPGAKPTEELVDHMVEAVPVK